MPSFWRSYLRHGSFVLLAFCAGCRSRAPSSDGSERDAGAAPVVNADASVAEPPTPVDGGLPDAPVPSWVSVGSYDSQTYELWDALQDVSRDAARIFCECETGQTDGDELESCIDRDAPRLAPPLAECTKAMLSNEPRSKAALECRLDARSTYVECVVPLECSGLFGADLTNCDLDRFIAEEMCPDVPYQTVIGLEQQCYGRDPGPTWQCDNGDLILAEWYCDFERDCLDGSDETTCGHGAAQ